MSQGIYGGYPLYLHDVAWTVTLDLVQNEEGKSEMLDALKLLQGCANHGAIVREKENKQNGGDKR